MIKQKKHGQLIVVSGPSGSGKDTIVGKVIEENPNVWLSVSATSRKPRKGEEEGVNYYFVDREEFEKRIEDNYFLEYAEYAGNYYGTPKEKIIEKLDKGFDVVLVIEIQGAQKIKELIPEALFIFIMPPSERELLKRLSNRKTEEKDKILERFNIAYKEINEVTKYNYVVVNDTIEEAVGKVEAIIKAEKCRVDRIEEVLVANKEEIIHEFLMDEEFDNTRMKEKIEVEE
ncbi:MAG: guanylate kinase [Bacilli bacterium]|nr:guanylate kinase [Bacilli bacterium]